MPELAQQIFTVDFVQQEENLAPSKRMFNRTRKHFCSEKASESQSSKKYLQREIHTRQVHSTNFRRIHSACVLEVH